MDKVIVPIAMIVAVVIGIAMYTYAFSLIPAGANNPPEEINAAQVLWVTGAVYLIAFVVLNFWLERVWFPRPHRIGPGVKPVPPLVGETKRAHIGMGALEATVFIAGIILIGTGCSLMGTRGYGSF